MKGGRERERAREKETGVAKRLVCIPVTVKDVHQMYDGARLQRVCHVLRVEHDRHRLRPPLQHPRHPRPGLATMPHRRISPQRVGQLRRLERVRSASTRPSSDPHRSPAPALVALRRNCPDLEKERGGSRILRESAVVNARTWWASTQPELSALSAAPVIAVRSESYEPVACPFTKTVTRLAWIATRLLQKK